MKILVSLGLVSATLLSSSFAKAASCKEKIFELYDPVKPKVQITSIQRRGLTATSITYGVRSIVITKAQTIQNLEVITFDQDCKITASKNYAIND
ncbi:hypothetical protein D3C87_104280 [compost metagenome]